MSTLRAKSNTPNPRYAFPLKPPSSTLASQLRTLDSPIRRNHHSLYLRSRTVCRTRANTRLKETRRVLLGPLDFAKMAKAISQKFSVFHVCSIQLPNTTRTDRIEALDRSSKGSFCYGSKWMRTTFYNRMSFQRKSQCAEVQTCDLPEGRKSAGSEQGKKSVVSKRQTYLPTIKTMMF